jgi:hypothetical protein
MLVLLSTLFRKQLPLLQTNQLSLLQENLLCVYFSFHSISELLSHVNLQMLDMLQGILTQVSQQAIRDHEYIVKQVGILPYKVH